MSNRPSLAKTSPAAVSIADLPPHDDNESRQIALWVAQAAIDKKAIGIEIIDVRGKIDYADFIVVMSGMSDRHVKAVAESIEGELFIVHGVRALAVEGLPSAQWVLVDFVDVVVHVFVDLVRDEYDLGGLWMDAPRVPLPQESAAGALLSESPRQGPKESERDESESSATESESSATESESDE